MYQLLEIQFFPDLLRKHTSRHKLQFMFSKNGMLMVISKHRTWWTNVPQIPDAFSIARQLGILPLIHPIVAQTSGIQERVLHYKTGVFHPWMESMTLESDSRISSMNSQVSNFVEKTNEQNMSLVWSNLCVYNVFEFNSDII